jgi:hypothetical protein
VVNELQTFINKRIGNIYGIDVGVGLTEKRLMKLRQNQISDASVEFNLKFLNKTLKDIFSEDVTGRITNYSPDRNKEVIEELIIDISRNDSNGKKPKGRKKNGEDSTNSNHNKYSDDNSRRKIKRIIISELQDYINERIAYKYGNDIGEGMIKKRLMKLCQNQISNASIGFNIDFLNKTLKDIFSEDVTGRITNYSSDRNKEVIQELINNKDLVKRDYFEGLFNLTFFDCLKYFRDDDIEPHKLQYLEGFTKFNEIKDKFYKKKDKNYINHISKYLKDYEKILFKKKPRKSKKGQKSEKIKISH